MLSWNGETPSADSASKKAARLSPARLAPLRDQALSVPTGWQEPSDAPPPGSLVK